MRRRRLHDRGKGVRVRDGLALGVVAFIAIIALQRGAVDTRSAVAATTAPMAPAPVTLGSALIADGFKTGDPSRSTLAPEMRVAVEPTYEAVDASTALGFGQMVETWSACEAKFVGGDRLRDVIVVYHDARTPGSPTNLPGAQLFRNTGSSYRIVFSWSRFSPQGNVPDRHDCIPGDWNADGRMDVYFTAGRGGGNGVKDGRANELWIQKAPNVWVDRAAEWEVQDRCGRSHHGARLDANLDGLPDLYVGNAPPRDDPDDPCDAIPGSEESHLYLNVAGRKFVDATQTYGLTGNGGVNCASAPDYNKDGARDLLVCRAAGLLVLRNQDGSGFVDQRAALGIPTTNFSDAKAFDVTNDGIRDLVTIVGNAVQVRPGMSGTARTIYSTTLGERIAIGDATRDGWPDVYVLRSNPLNRTNPQDVVLVSTGTAWSPVAVPNASGIGDFALYLAGIPGYLVGNGRSESIGKLQAIKVRPS
jgi:FG-GAP-like repeat